ncbi:MAG: hypothetical protein ACD_9C00156G0004 [uncultured bacterium]|nr:MAG: hypothetical protein ACD_9C00156G0004 [uncultured bacterium]
MTPARNNVVFTLQGGFQMDDGEMKKVFALKQEIEEVERRQIMARNKFITLLTGLGFVFYKNDQSPSILNLRFPYPVTGWPHNWYSFLEITASSCYFEKDNTTLGEFKADIFNVFETPDFNHGYDAYTGIRVDPGGNATDKDLTSAIKMAMEMKFENAKKIEERDLSFVRAVSVMNDE